MSNTTLRWGKAIAEVSATKQAADTGFNYVAITMEYIMGSDDRQFTLQKKLFGQYQLIPEVCLSVLPAGVVITAPGFNFYYWLDYLKRALQRLANIGCHTLLWRDGAARSLPLEGDETAAKEQCLQFIYMLCRLCEEHGIAVMVEPLSTAATNHLNTVNEVEDFIAQINKSNLHLAISLANATAFCSDIKSANSMARIRHICIETLPAFTAASVLPTVDKRCLFTLLGDADRESLHNARRLIKS